MNRFLALLIAPLAAGLLVLQDARAEDGQGAADPHPRVRLETAVGEIVLELDREKAPRTVENFLRYVRDGFFDGTLFHRVVPGFVIQGGGFVPGKRPGVLRKKPARAPIPNESNNGLQNLRGTVAMARTADPHSANSQFYINLGDNTNLDHRESPRRQWGYAVFGRVITGWDTVERIANAPSGGGGMFSDSMPEDPVVIRKAVVLSSPAEAKDGAESPPSNSMAPG